MSEPLPAHQEGHGTADEFVTYAVRGCQYPGCGAETRAYVEINGQSYCENHAPLVQTGEVFKPLVGTGDP